MFVSHLLSAKKFAQKAVKKQKSAFKEWGVMADWENSCYFTTHPQYEANQLEVFFQMHEKVRERSTVKSALKTNYT